MTEYFVACSDVDGRVLAVGAVAMGSAIRQDHGPNSIVALVDESTAMAVEANPEGWRLWGGVMVAREPLSPAPVVSKTTIAADGIDSAVITGLPQPCRILISGIGPIKDIEVPDGEVEITSTAKAKLAISVLSTVEFAPWRVTIHAD